MTTDELFCYKLPNIDHAMNLMMLLAVHAGITGFIALLLPTTTVYCYVMVAWSLFGVSFINLNVVERRRRKFFKCLYEKAKIVPSYKIQAAKKMEKDTIKALLWAIECEEAHIGGDCPLCGAE